MSNRAIRKALRQRELTRPDPTVPEGQEQGSDEERSVARNPFALLGEDGGSDDENEGEEEQEEEVKVEEVKKGNAEKGKKRKKKGKGKGVPVGGGGDQVALAGELKELGIGTEAEIDKVLEVDVKGLDAVNEVRQLFGKAAFQSDEEGPRRRGGAGGGVGGRAAFGSARRNVLSRAKDTWPPGGSGGLGMEVVGRDDATGVTEFRFVHSTAYQDVQRQFIMCAESLDPERLVQLLQFNPYHIATLLQLSHMLSQDRDFAGSGELLDRALFNFGRSLHSTFVPKLSEGKARLSFLRPENREFWLCCWRQITSLAMRGIWRTAEEYGRLLLALSPERDPYQICLIIDFLSLKARQPERFLALAEHDRFRKAFAHLPNIAYSTALAYYQLNKDALAREYLAKAITKFPWVLRKLYVELSIRHNPTSPLAAPSLSNSTPNTLQEVLTELYVGRAKDLWKAPECLRLLAKVAGSVYNLPQTPSSLIVTPFSALGELTFSGVNIDVARHITMTDNLAALSHLPIEWKSGGSLYHDPLPPPEQVESYDLPSSAQSWSWLWSRSQQQEEETEVAELL